MQLQKRLQPKNQSIKPVKKCQVVNVWSFLKNFYLDQIQGVFEFGQNPDFAGDWDLRDRHQPGQDLPDFLRLRQKSGPHPAFQRERLGTAHVDVDGVDVVFDLFKNFTRFSQT